MSDGSEHSAPPRSTRCARAKLAILIAATAALALLVLFHFHHVNGPYYWTWPWRRLGIWPLYPLMLAAALPFVLAQFGYLRKWRITLCLLLLAGSTFALQFAAIVCQPPTRGERFVALVKSAMNTSYYTDAVIPHHQSNISLSRMMYMYADIAPLLHLHAKYKPPGLMLYYLLLVNLLGEGTPSAVAGGIGVALLAAAAVPATYALVACGARDESTAVDATRDAAFSAASFFSLCPSLILFLPQFDQTYPAIACMILILFMATVRGRHPLWPAIALGAIMALALFCSYIFLVFGLFMIVYWMLMIADGKTARAQRGLIFLVLAVAAFGAIYFLLWLLYGFDPIATYRSIAAAQAGDLVALKRPFPLHMIFDVLDLALGTGWISFILIFFLLIHLGRRIFDRDAASQLILVSLLEVATVAAAALLPGETARLWLPIMPLLMVPIGFELARWPMKYRAISYACLFLLLVVIAQNMIFIYMGTELDGPRW